MFSDFMYLAENEFSDMLRIFMKVNTFPLTGLPTVKVKHSPVGVLLQLTRGCSARFYFLTVNEMKSIS